MSLLFSEHGTSVLKLRRTQSGLKPHTPTEPPHKHQYHPRPQAQIAFPLVCCSAVSAPMGKSSETFSRPSAARISSEPPGVDFVRPPRGRISFPILHGQNPPPLSGKTIPLAQKRHKFLFGAWGYTRAPWRFPMNALPFFPPDAGRTISTLRVDDIRLCRTISTPAAWTIFASRGSQTMKPLVPAQPARAETDGSYLLPELALRAQASA